MTASRGCDSLDGFIEIEDICPLHVDYGSGIKFPATRYEASAERLNGDEHRPRGDFDT